MLSFFKVYINLFKYNFSNNKSSKVNVLFKSKLNDIYHKKMMKNLSTFGKVFLYIRRFLVHLLILGLFGVSGYGFFKLNKLSVEVKNKFIQRLKLDLKNLNIFI